MQKLRNRRVEAINLRRNVGKVKIFGWIEGVDWKLGTIDLRKITVGESISRTLKPNVIFLRKNRRNRSLEGRT